MKTLQEYRVIQWNTVGGDLNFRLNHDLNENSIVFDVGGYKGETSEAIFKKYNCTIHIFEPIEEYCEIMREMFKENEKIHIHQFGLSNKTEKTEISLLDNSSSHFKSADNKVEISLVKISDFIKENGINQIDLMDINIEAAEYGLIEDLIESKDIDIVKNLQVQFHDFIENAENRMIAIQTNLEKTHFLTFQYKFVWENWTKLSPGNNNFIERQMHNNVKSSSQLNEANIQFQMELDALKPELKELSEKSKDYVKEIEVYKNKFDSRSYRYIGRAQRLYSKLRKGFIK